MSRRPFGPREVVALALLAVAVAIAWPYLDPDGSPGQPRPVERGTPTMAPLSISGWTLEAWIPSADRPVFSGESHVLDVDWDQRPWSLRARAVLTLPAPGLWTLVFEHGQPFRVTVDGGGTYDVAGGGSGVTTPVSFHHPGGELRLEVESWPVGDRLRLRLVSVSGAPAAP